MCCLPSGLSVFKQRALPPATELGALVLQGWKLPEQMAAAELELVWAVASHRYACLRCPQLDASK